MSPTEEKARHSTPTPASPRPTDEGGGCAPWVYGAIFGVWAYAVLFYLPSQVDPARMDREPLTSRVLGIAAARPLAESKYEALANMRVLPLRGANVDVFMPQSVFEDVPFPDRSGWLDEIRKEWCGDDVTRESWWLLSRVSVRDIRSGDKLDSRYCLVLYLKEIW